MKLITGNANHPLSQEISDYLNLPLAEATVKHFADQEIFAEIEENVRGVDVFVVQSTSYPANDNLMELLVLIDALRRGSAGQVTAVIPYYGYARQDRKSSPRSPITAKLVANLIGRAGADRVVTMDLHAGQIQGFFDIPTDNLFAMPVFQADILNHYDPKNVVVVSPDVGGVVRARHLASRLETDLAIIDKRRPEPGQSQVMNVIGSVESMDCIMIDDIVDSAGTLVNAADALIAKGAKSVSAYVTHGVLSDGSNAVERVQNSHLKELVVTNSIKATDKIRACKKIRHVSVAPLLGEAIRRIDEKDSISVLFK